MKDKLQMNKWHQQNIIHFYAANVSRIPMEREYLEEEVIV